METGGNRCLIYRLLTFVDLCRAESKLLKVKLAITGAQLSSIKLPSKLMGISTSSEYLLSYEL